MGTPHKHAELIKLWADGAEIECQYAGKWNLANHPMWDEGCEYRIKPKEEKKPVVRWLWIDCNGHITQQFFSCEEIDRKFPKNTMRPLDFSRTEFPE